MAERNDIRNLLFAIIDYERVLCILNDIDKTKGAKQRETKSAIKIMLAIIILMMFRHFLVFSVFSISFSYFCFPIREYAKLFEIVLSGDSFRMLHAFTFAGVPHAVSYNPLAFRRFLRRRVFEKTDLGHL